MSGRRMMKSFGLPLWKLPPPGFSRPYKGKPRLIEANEGTVVCPLRGTPWPPEACPGCELLDRIEADGVSCRMHWSGKHPWQP